MKIPAWVGALYLTIVAAIMAALSWIFGFMGTEFCLGVIFGAMMFEVSHKAHTGRWFID